LISEKGTDMANLNKYLFLVHARANKKQIRQAVGSIYGVKVAGVNIICSKERGAEYKKAFVTLQPGQSIDIVPH
jgi:large subunit ribosomal protein L23